MTTYEYTKAKATITAACNSTGLSIPDLAGVLASVLADAREQMTFELAGELQILNKKLNDQEEVE